MNDNKSEKSLTKDEFEKNYCRESEITLDEYNENFVTLPCKCNDKDCLGWACVCNDKLSIKNHMDLYG